MKLPLRRPCTVMTTVVFVGLAVLLDAEPLLAQDTTRGAPIPTAADSMIPGVVGSLGGIVTSLSGAPLGGADIVVNGTALRAKARSDGRFLLAGIPSGFHEVLIRKLGFEPAEITLNTVAGVQLSVTVKLHQLAPRLDTVTITAQLFNELSGQVTDTTDRPLADVDVQILGTDIHMRTRRDGRYLFFDVPPGKYVLRIRKLGYHPAQKAVEMTRRLERHLTIRLWSLAQDLAPVVVTEESGFGRAEAIMREFEVRQKMAGSQSDFITRDELKRFGKSPLTVAIREWGKGSVKGLAGISCVLVDGDLPGPAVHAFSDGTRIQVEGGTSMVTSGTLKTQAATARTITTGETPPLGYFFADQVEAIELYPTGSEMSMTACARLPNVNGCDCTAWGGPPPIVIVWLRK